MPLKIYSERRKMFPDKLLKQMEHDLDNKGFLPADLEFFKELLVIAANKNIKSPLDFVNTWYSFLKDIDPKNIN